jgi:hypothetical protein
MPDAISATIGSRDSKSTSGAPSPSPTNAPITLNTPRLHKWAYRFPSTAVYLKDKEGATMRFTICLLFISILVFTPIVSKAAVMTATTCSYSDVLSTYNSASAGDTVSIPSGNCTWSSTLTISKGLTLMGAGSGLTIITWGGSTSENTLVLVSLSSDVNIRITGIGFNLLSNTAGDRSGIKIMGDRSGSFALTKLRIDHCSFTKGRNSLFIDGWVYGVADHNTFTNVYSAIFYRGDDNHAWARPIAAGTANAFFVENNTFTLNNSVDTTTQDAQIYVQEGASTVVRYNTFDSTAMTSVGFLTLMFNHHGNQEYINGVLGTNFRGQPISESYNNIARVYTTAGGQFQGYRGGSVIVHDETFTSILGGDEVIYLTEEESWQTAFFSPLRTTWPAQDQVFNSFIWNCTYNGTPITTSAVDAKGAVLSIHVASDATFIQQNRDFFMHAPQASGGNESFVGRAGGSNTAPTTNDTGTMIFTSSGPNAYYPYTPYTYPHPLTAGGSVPASPTNLQVQ